MEIILALRDILEIFYPSGIFWRSSSPQGYFEDLLALREIILVQTNILDIILARRDILKIILALRDNLEIILVLRDILEIILALRDILEIILALRFGTS